MAPAPRPLSGFDAVHPSPVGPLGIRVTADRVIGIEFLSAGERSRRARAPLAAEAVRQLDAYFSDPGWAFTLPLEEAGTDYQRRVWAALRRIPVGATRSYGALAGDLGSAPRPVGGACRRNPLVIVTPCHRVVAGHGIGGFAGAVSGRPITHKRWLLDHEQRWLLDHEQER